jgi:hypothetical protein
MTVIHTGREGTGNYPNKHEHGDAKPMIAVETAVALEQQNF